uniref:Uncharacterized protein n=1 Tax=Meloidogyne enterolobii TaxID=390850 RepID=A0A6V7V0M3_MELEN|nr:unnamed protein product [Meloidogyne enterolobii]
MATILLNNRFFVAIVLLLNVVGSVFGRSVPRFLPSTKEPTTTTNAATTTTTAITPSEIIPVFDQNFFQHTIGEWKVWSVAAAMYLAMNALVYVLTYCCYLEKKCAVATVSPKSASASSSTVVEFSNVEYSESAKTAGDLSVRTAKSLSLPSAKQTSRKPQNHKKPKRKRRGELQSLKNLQSFLLQKVQKNQRQNQHPLERRLLPKQQQVRKGRVLQRELRKLGKLLLHREEAKAVNRPTAQKKLRVLLLVRMKVKLVVGLRVLAEKKEGIEKYVNNRIHWMFIFC